MTLGGTIGGSPDGVTYTYDGLTLLSLAATRGQDRHNLVSDPSFELDADSNGVADEWWFGENCAGTPTLSIVSDPAPGGAAKGQRVQYSGQAGDQDSYLYLVQDTEVGSFAAGNDATFAISVKGTVPTDTLEL